MIYLAIILFLLSAVAKSQCDRKAFKEGGVEASEGHSWLLRVALSFLLGKWHFWDAVRVMSLCIAITLLGGLDWFFIIVLYTIHGLIFELLYRIK